MENETTFAPQEIVKSLEDGFSETYKPYQKYQKDNHPLWKSCMDAITSPGYLEKLVFVNDKLKVPPVRVYACTHLEDDYGKNLSPADKKFLGCFFAYIFKAIFCYRNQKQVSTTESSVKTALYFLDCPQTIRIVEDASEKRKTKKPKSEGVEENESDKVST
jgi:hypothetical protein